MLTSNTLGPGRRSKGAAQPMSALFLNRYYVRLMPCLPLPVPHSLRNRLRWAGYLLLGFGRLPNHRFRHSDLPISGAKVGQGRSPTCGVHTGGQVAVRGKPVPAPMTEGGAGPGRNLGLGYRLDDTRLLHPGTRFLFSKPLRVSHAR